MSPYAAPLRDMTFVLNELAGLEQVAAMPGFEEAGPETTEAILGEAARFASGVLAPLNREGDVVGCTSFEPGGYYFAGAFLSIKSERSWA